MNEEFQDTRTNDPDSLTNEDREILKRKILTSTGIINAVKHRKAGEEIISKAQFPHTAPKVFHGVLLIVSGLIVALGTSFSAIGIITGMIMVISGIILSFTNTGRARHRHTI